VPVVGAAARGRRTMDNHCQCGEREDWEVGKRFGDLILGENERGENRKGVTRDGEKERVRL
jgi:hypothetical protein